MNDIVIRPCDGPLVGPLKCVHNAEEAQREIDRLLGRSDDD